VTSTFPYTRLPIQRAAIAEANAREAEADAVRWREAAEHARREAVRREAKQNTR
jgi:hypothetical protein